MPAPFSSEFSVTITDQEQNAPGHNDLLVASCTSGTPADALPEPPILGLPFEVLSDIFILALPNDEDFTKDRRLLAPRLTKPLTFCGVCSLWRSWALATPQLWQRVFVRIPPGISRQELLSKATDLISWIERTASLPLTLFLSYGVTTRLDEKESASPVVEVLNRYATRWKTLYLRYGGPRWPDPPAERRSQLFRFAEWSSLKKIHSFRQHSGPIGNETIPWAQLTHLEILQDLPYGRAMDIFKGCPKLVWLSIHVEPLHHSERLVTSPIVQCGLSCMSLMADRTSEVISSISLPSLQEMSIHAISWRSQTDLESLLQFFTRSSCMLSKLEVTGSPYPQDLINVLTHKSCDSLTSLTLGISYFDHYASVDDEVLRRLTLRQDDCLCTRLKFLTLRRCIRGSFSALLSMVESRISSYPGQLSDGLLHYLYLQIRNVDGGEEKLDQIIKKSEMKYSVRTKDRDLYSVSLQRKHRERRRSANVEC